MKSSINELFLFRIHDDCFAVDIACTKEIKKVTDITPVYDALWYIRGIINLRGKIVTIFDIPALFSGSVERNHKGSQKILIVVWQGEDIGLMVDEVDDIIECRTEQIHPAPPNMDASFKSYAKTVYKTGDKIIPILDLDALLPTPNKESPSL
jgi:purine-binding chemotaxis protein CheW